MPLHMVARSEGLAGHWTAEDLVQEFKKLRCLLDRAEEVAHGIVEMLAEAGIVIVGSRGPRTTRKASSRQPRFNDPKWKRLAEPGVGQVRIGEATQRKVPIAIDGAKEFMVTAGAADLLTALLAVDAADEDGFPAFRSYTELAAAYSARTGRPESARAVVVGIGRLREQLLGEGKVSPLLVEAVPRQGARFRIRRRRK